MGWYALFQCFWESEIQTLQHLQQEQRIHFWHSLSSSEPHISNKRRGRWQWQCTKCISGLFNPFLPCFHSLFLHSFSACFIKVPHLVLLRVICFIVQRWPCLRFHMSLDVGMFPTNGLGTAHSCFMHDMHFFVEYHSKNMVPQGNASKFLSHVHSFKILHFHIHLTASICPASLCVKYPFSFPVELREQAFSSSSNLSAHLN